MSNNFTRALAFTLPWEVGKDKNGNLRSDGGYTNDPRDPGGETKWGISKLGNPDLDIKNLTLEQAIERYKTKYYDVYKNYKTNPITLDDLAVDLAVAVFDSGVNCGVNRAYNWCVVSMKTKDPVKTLLGLRKDFYTTRKNYHIYGKGWLNRLNDLAKYCYVLSAENTPIVPQDEPSQQGSLL